MLADLDLLLIAVFCAADDLLPEPAKNARRILTDAEVVTLAVAQAIMGIPSDPRFLRMARKQLAHLFPLLPNRPGYLKRRQRLSDTIEALTVVFASDSPRPTTATAPATAATSGASVSTPCSRSTAPHAH